MRRLLGKQRAESRSAVRGMTLIEIMVVITIIGLIAAAVTVAVIPQLQKAQVDRTVFDIKSIESSLKLYYARKGNYPDTATGLKGLVDMQILEKMPQDAWNHDYIYVLERGKPIVTSYGRDGVPGGEGPDADISNRPDQKPQ
jgi:general secretion pathway protein G